MLHAAIVLLAYLLGSIPFGYLLVRLSVGGDVRETGSGGTGATNVTRRAGKGVGVLTLLLDLLKGTAAVLIARALPGADEETDPDVPTETPPPYFPQNPLSPGDEKTARKLRLTFYGCALLVAHAVIAATVGVVYLVRSLL